MGTAFETESRAYSIYQSIGFLKSAPVYEPIIFLDIHGTLKRGRIALCWRGRGDGTAFGRYQWSVRCDGDMIIDVVW